MEGDDNIKYKINKSILTQLACFHLRKTTALSDQLNNEYNAYL